MAKHNASSHTSFDVPLPLALAVLVLVVAGFLPYITPRGLRGTLPTELPPLVVSGDANWNAHEAVPHQDVPVYLDEALDRLGESTLSRDHGLIAASSRTFADALIQAGGDDPEVRKRLREVQLIRFMNHADRGVRDPLVEVARRHRLLTTRTSFTSVDAARARAWFSFRWEAAGARAVLRQEQAPLDQLMLALLPEDRKALLSWVFSASCETLMGVPQETAFNRATIERCTSARRDFLALAPQVDSTYPVNLASASLLCLESLHFRRTAAHAVDPVQRAHLDRLAQEGLARAHGEFNNLLAGDVDPRQRPTIERYFLGTERASATTDP